MLQSLLPVFVAGETLPGIICSPSNKSDMLSNVSQVIDFMIERNIRMHVTYAEGCFHSVCRLIFSGVLP